MTAARPAPPAPATRREGRGPRPEVLAVGKYHGLGNDFLVALDPGIEPDGALARRLCDRRRGIGADGLVVGRRLPAGGGVGRAGSEALCFRLFNADGSEAEMSGNGLRCLAHAAFDAGILGPGAPVEVATPAGPRSVEVSPRGPGLVWAESGMGRPEILGGDAGCCNVDHGRLRVRVGNPHLVVAGPDPSGSDLAALGPGLGAGDASDPEGRNVELVALGPGPDELTMRVWERGVGETEACGTGSVAAAVAFHHWGRVGATVTVHQPGGSLVVRLLADGTARLAGPSERVATCEVPLG